MENEIEINLGRLCISIFKHWRQVLIFILLGALLGCGISYFKMDNDVESYLESLEEEKINKDNIRLYADYNTLYQSALELGDTSVLLKMNQNNVWSSSYSFFVSGAVEDTERVTATFKSLISDSENLNKLLKASGLSCSLSDIKEMVLLDLESTIAAKDQQNSTANISIEIVAPTEASCDGLMSALEEIINSKKSNSFQFVQLGSKKVVGYNSAVAEKQFSYLTSRQNLLSQMATAKGKLSEDEKLYYSFYFDRDNMKDDSCFSVKWPVIFAVVFALVDCVILACLFIFSKKITNEKELSEQFNLEVLGSIDNSKPRHGLDKLFDNWEKTNLPVSNNPNYIAQMIDSFSVSTVSLVLDSEDNDSKELASSLCEEKINTKLLVAGNIAVDSLALNAIKANPNVIVISHVNKTLKEDVKKYIQIAQRMGVKILGAIVIR